ncbi:hypothetical protein [Porphyromonas catoniae]|uniref:hypothetical protein n=1 Tax=Porphyromonas catoniae TaxID=41976 RepID=UPI0023EF9EA2|nr:hypothetical protein [Porphyromonas catoniae]
MKKGKLKTALAEEALQSSFLKSNSKDGVFENFMKNFIKKFNEPKHLCLYKALANNVDQGVGNLKSALQNGQSPEDKATPQASQVAFDDFLPKQKIETGQIFSSPRVCEFSLATQVTLVHGASPLYIGLAPCTRLCSRDLSKCL